MASRGGLRPEFWKLPLDRLRPAEWEALCDGCGKCCLIKLEDEDTGEVHLTSVACRLLDTETCRCGNYANRKALVPACVMLTPKKVRESLHWLPSTCAYRLRAKGMPLPDWHPLLTGDPESVHRAGISLRGAMVPEYEVAEEELEDHLIDEEL
ncbi:MAG TPA: YcgN family cysteine cluster protein [Paracoccaceae bacterium]|nr:YcgN family cysteine cluster protein [Paracoccaceae bacterium]